MARTTPAELGDQADQGFRRAVSSLGHEAVPAPDDSGWDVTVTVDGLEVCHVVLKAGSVIAPEVAAQMIASTDRRRTTVAHVMVGDLITTAAKDTSRAAGWGWIDRRGHLVLRAKGVHIDAQVPADNRHPDAPRKTSRGTLPRTEAILGRERSLECFLTHGGPRGVDRLASYSIEPRSELTLG